MSWEQEITEKLQEAQSIAIRFDVSQDITDAQKSTARNNVDVTTTKTNISSIDSGSDYSIEFNY